jgi:hypothetical protein
MIDTPRLPEKGATGGSQPFRPKNPDKYSGDGGETLESWLFGIEKRMDYCAISNNRKRIQYTALQFDGRTLVWWRNLKERTQHCGELLPVTRTTFKRALRTEFQPMCLERLARAKLDTAQQTITVTGFVDDFRRLKWDIPGITNTKLRYGFEKGLTSPTIADAITAW